MHASRHHSGYAGDAAGPLDFGTPFDRFDPRSATANAAVGGAAHRHRQLLVDLMGRHGFDNYRNEMNEKLLGANHLGIKRFFALDTQAYENGALDKKTKELMGLAASIVLRCDDCITYHIKQCAECDVTREQFMDAFNIALVVGGSITIPHLRRAVEKLDQVLGS